MKQINKKRTFVRLDKAKKLYSSLQTSRFIKLRKLFFHPLLFFKFVFYKYLHLFSKVSLLRVRTIFGKKMYITVPPYLDVWQYGAYISSDAELRLTKFLIAVANDTTIFFDVGANIGYYSFLVSRLSSDAKIYAFEPNQSILPVLKKNKQNNMFIVPKALSDTKESSLFFSYDLKDSGLSTLDMTNFKRTSITKPFFKETKVLTTTLDSFCRERCMNPTILKIDVEGSEEKVLKGAKNLLKRNNLIVIMEVWFMPYTSNYKRCLSLLQSLTFKCYHITSSGSLKLLPYSSLEKYFYRLQQKYNTINDSSNFDNLIFIK